MIIILVMNTQLLVASVYCTILQYSVKIGNLEYRNNWLEVCIIACHNSFIIFIFRSCIKKSFFLNVRAAQLKHVICIAAMLHFINFTHTLSQAQSFSLTRRYAAHISLLEPQSHVFGKSKKCSVFPRCNIALYKDYHDQ